MFELKLLRGREVSSGTYVPARRWTEAATVAMAALVFGMILANLPALRGLSEPGTGDPFGLTSIGGGNDLPGLGLAALRTSLPVDTPPAGDPGSTVAGVQHARVALTDYKAMADRIPNDKLDHAARDQNLMQSEHAQRRVAGFLAGRYGVASDIMREYVSTARDAARMLHIDPLLILAVMAVESNYRAGSANPSGALGLMQVIPEFHEPELAPFGGAHAVQEPHVNILVGGLVLKQYIALTGSLSLGLRYYVGASDPGTDDQGYVRKVSGELKSLREMVAGYRAPGAMAGAAP